MGQFLHSLRLWGADATFEQAWQLPGRPRLRAFAPRDLGPYPNIRAYLARMFRRYGSWADALAAYNWGPANLDAWIAAGRPPERMPDETRRYTETVLRDALLTLASW